MSSTISSRKGGRVSLPVGENCPPVVIKSQQTGAKSASPTAHRSAERPAPSFGTLLAFVEQDSRPYVVTRGDKTVKLSWPGVKISPSQLAELLRTLPGGRRLDGATRFGSRVATLSFDGKLRRGRLTPPTQQGMVLVWTEPESDLAELDSAARTAYEPEGECLGKLVLEANSLRAVAKIYRHSEQRAPGFVLLRQGEVIVEPSWLDTLDKPEEARLCQVVVDGELPWEEGVPVAFRARFAKLAKLAAQKSKELLDTLPAPEENRGLVLALLESPKFMTLTDGRRGELPPLPTIGQVLELLHASGGRRRVSNISETMGIPEIRFEQILRQMDSVLRKDEQVCLSRSLDGEWLLLHQDVLIRLFALNPEARASDGLVTATDLEGRERSVDVPVELEPKERRVVEALLRYGRLSERELSQIVGSRRVGGLLEKLVSRMEAAGSYLVRTVHGASDDGRIYELAS